MKDRWKDGPWNTNQKWESQAWPDIDKISRDLRSSYSRQCKEYHACHSKDYSRCSIKMFLTIRVRSCLPQMNYCRYLSQCTQYRNNHWKYTDDFYRNGEERRTQLQFPCICAQIFTEVPIAKGLQLIRFAGSTWVVSVRLRALAWGLQLESATTLFSPSLKKALPTDLRTQN